MVVSDGLSLGLIRTVLLDGLCLGLFSFIG